MIAVTTLLGKLTALTIKPRRLATVVLAVLIGYALFVAPDDSGDVNDVKPMFGESCKFTVTVSSLNVRSGPSEGDPVISAVTSGQLVVATDTVRNGFRELSPGYWAADRYLAPRTGNSC